MLGGRCPVKHAKWMIAALAAATAMPATAQVVSPNQNATGRALILVPLQLTRIDDLSFGTVISSPAAGTVTMPADGTARTVGGGVTAVASDPGLRALFGGAGSPNQLVTFTLTPPAVLTSTTNPADTIPVSLVLEYPSVNIDPVTRAFYVGVGGTLNIAADQPDGVYEAIFNLEAQYQ